jgi:hypothetical protein
MKWDALLTNRKHYRGDLMLIRKAVREGWVTADADLQAIVDRLGAVMRELSDVPATTPGLATREILRAAALLLELEKASRKRGR